jgi:hypothetical protein
MADISYQNSTIEIVKSEAQIVIYRHPSTIWLVLRDCFNGLRGAGISVGEAYTMIYVEPYNGKPSRSGPGPDRH